MRDSHIGVAQYGQRGLHRSAQNCHIFRCKEMRLTPCSRRLEVQGGKVQAGRAF